DPSARARIVHGPPRCGKGVCRLDSERLLREGRRRPSRNTQMTPAKRLFSSFAMLLLGCTALPGCAGNSWVEVGGQRYMVEVADDTEERARGLMFRDELPAGTGMLFIDRKSVV